MPTEIFLGFDGEHNEDDGDDDDEVSPRWGNHQSKLIKKEPFTQASFVG